jgi:phosphoenolpyruvate synthase/pyruvate phosphate dikinase
VYNRWYEVIKLLQVLPFTIDPDTGFQNTIIINGGWGLGENIVKGAITPDEWMVFKPTLENIKLNPFSKTLRPKNSR